MKEEVCPICEKEESLAFECINCGRIVCQSCCEQNEDGDYICADCLEI
jgi:hypothetical protein